LKFENADHGRKSSMNPVPIAWRKTCDIYRSRLARVLLKCEHCCCCCCWPSWTSISTTADDVLLLCVYPMARQEGTGLSAVTALLERLRMGMEVRPSLSVTDSCSWVCCHLLSELIETRHCISAPGRGPL